MSASLVAMLVILSAIGVAAVSRRLLFYVSPKVGPLDGGFVQHPILTIAHILPGLAFVLLGPLQLARGLRSRHPAWHRRAGRVTVIAGAIIGVTALVMSPQMAIGGPVETAATSLFGVLFLVSLTKGFVAIRAGRAAEHREWMLRAFAIGMAVTTTRPIVGIFFATSRLTHLTPREFFGIAFWIGFTLHLAAAEIRIRRTRRGQRTISPLSVPAG